MGNLLIKILQFLVRLGESSLFPLGSMLFFFVGFYSAAQAMLADVWAAIGAIELYGTDFTLADGYVPIARLNRFLPLYEFVLMAGAYYSAASVVVIFRWVKSFVPTVSN